MDKSILNRIIKDFKQQSKKVLLIENNDGFLFREDVQNILKDNDIECASGTNISQRVAFELRDKSSIFSLLNSAFPFSFDVLRIMGKFFSVQDVINAETIKKNVSNIYGGNRATENGIYSVVPMFLEAGIFKRPKQGIYEFENILNYSTEIAKEIFIASFNQNNTIKRTLNNYQHSDSYFMFID